MKGLMYKNFWQFRRMLIFLCLFQLCISPLLCFGAYNLHASGLYGYIEGMDKFSITLVMASCFLCVFFTVGMMYSDIFLSDEKSLSASFWIASPQTLKGHLQSKYYMILVVNVIILFFCFITDTIVVAIVGDATISAMGICIYIFCFEIILAAVQIPCMVRFGAAYGIKVLGIIMGLIGLVAGVYFLFGDISFLLSEEPLKALLEKMLDWAEKLTILLGLIPYLTVVLYYASYRISLLIFRKGMENYEQ